MTWWPDEIADGGEEIESGCKEIMSCSWEIESCREEIESYSKETMPYTRGIESGIRQISTFVAEEKVPKGRYVKAQGEA